MRCAWAVLLVGCGASPQDALTYTEVWELLGVAGDGSVVDARVEVGNRGLLKGQGRVQVDHWPLLGEPIQYARWSAPRATERTGDGRKVTLDTDVLAASGELVDTWHLRARSDDANAVVQVGGRTRSIDAATTQVGGGQWSVGAPVGAGTLQGWIEAGERGGRLTGHGVVLHRGGDGLAGAERRTAVVLGDGVSIGVDEHGPVRLAWARVDGENVDVTDARVTLEAGVVGLDFRPAADLVVQFTTTGVGGRSTTTSELTSPERVVAEALMHTPDRLVLGARAEVRHGGRTVERPALIVWMDDRPVDVAPRKAPAPDARRNRRRL